MAVPKDDDEEGQARLRTHVETALRPHQATFEEAIARRDVQSAWRAACMTWVDFLLLRGARLRDDGTNLVPEFFVKVVRGELPSRQALRLREPDDGWGRGTRRTRDLVKVEGALHALCSHIGRAVANGQDETVARRTSQAIATWLTVKRRGDEWMGTDLVDKEDVPNLGALRWLEHRAADRRLQAVRGERLARIHEWKERLRAAHAAGKPKAVYAWLKNQYVPPVWALQRRDGSWTADPREMHQLVREAWDPIFNVWATAPQERPSWEAFSAEYGPEIAALRVDQRMDKITVEDLAEAIKSKRASMVGGLDSWQMAEVKLLPPQLLQLAVEIFDLAETGAGWPEAIEVCISPLIPKASDEGGPTGLRPIALMSVWYSVWSSARFRATKTWQARALPTHLAGGRSRREAGDAFYDTALAVEAAALDLPEQSDMLIAFGDRTKCFDRLVPEVMLPLLIAVGIDPRVATALAALYSNLRRLWRLGRFVGDPWRPGNGCLQGCALTVLLCNILFAIWVLRLRNVATAMVPTMHLLGRLLLPRCSKRP